MIRTPKRTVHLRLPQTERPDARAYFAEARRRRQTPHAVASFDRVALIAALRQAQGRGEQRKDRQS